MVVNSGRIIVLICFGDPNLHSTAYREVPRRFPVNDFIIPLIGDMGKRFDEYTFNTRKPVMKPQI